MDFTPTPLFYIIIGLLIGMVIGWMIGFFDSNGRTANKIQVAESKADAAIREAEKKIAQAEKQIALAAQSTQSPQDNPSLLRLKNDNGRFALEMDGAPITGVLSPDKKKRLLELVTVFRPWLEGAQPAQTVSQPIASVQTPPAPVSSQEPIFAPAQPPLMPLTKKPEQEKNFASLSIVQQIDTVLQARLVNTPLEKQGIRLQESPQGGVEVYVGLQKFLSVDDVPETFVKSEIRAAIAEWEEKYTPKL
jgi:hypothetical protein